MTGLCALDLRALDDPPQPPEYIVDGLLERQGVLLLAGDSATSKSIICLDLAAAIITGRQWLGRPVKAGRVLYVDAESSPRLVIDRLRALGLRSREAERLRMFVRQPLVLPHDGERLRELAAEHRADVVILDPALALMAVDANDNSGVAAMFSGVLRPLATDLDLAVVLVHHERKSAYNGSRDAAHAALGAMQWRAGADTHLALEVARSQPEPRQVDGRLRERYHVNLQHAKQRDGLADRARVELVNVQSDRGLDDRTLIRLAVNLVEGEQRPTGRRDIDAEIITALEAATGRLSRADLAAAVGMKATGSFSDRLNRLAASGRVVKSTAGHRAMWALP